MMNPKIRVIMHVQCINNSNNLVQCSYQNNYVYKQLTTFTVFGIRGFTYVH